MLKKIETFDKRQYIWLVDIKLLIWLLSGFDIVFVFRYLMENTINTLTPKQNKTK